MIGISIKPTIGIGDALQYSSLPENYFRATGQKLYDVNKQWFFDFNPYVERGEGVTCEKIQEMWNFSPNQYAWPIPNRPDKPKVYLSNADIWASLFKVPLVLNRPRLYRFEDFPFEDRKNILLHSRGISHGQMPDHIVAHIVKKYGKTGNLYQIGLEDQNLGIPFLPTPTLWDLAELISKSRMVIGVDSSPCWIAACYPDVVTKVVRTKPQPDQFCDWVPLEINNIHSHWDDRSRTVYNPSEDDRGFTSSYRRI